MRGKPMSLDVSFRGNRNIPAHAGKTVYGQLYIERCSEHPRACGENEAS